MNSFFQDLRYAVRILKKNPGFTAMAVLTLALGVGANTAIFSVVNAVVLRPLDFKSPNSLFILSTKDVKRGLSGGDFSYPCFRMLHERDQSFESVEAYSYETFNLIGGDAPEQLQAVRASAGIFDALGVTPAVGRTFLKGEDEPGAPPVVILGHDLWLRRFGADPTLVGRGVTLDGLNYSVVGVLPTNLEAPFRDIDVWVPRPYESSIFPAERVQTGSGFLAGVARLKSGTSFSQAQAELDALAHQYQKAFPANSDAIPDGTIQMVSLTDSVLGEVRTTLWVLLGAVGFVLLIACANVSNLFLARAAGRGKEIAVRAALGATRSRLIRQLLTESVFLALLGGALGLFVASSGVRLISASPYMPLPRATGINVDGRVLIFSLVVSVLAGVLFGLAPAWRTSKFSLVTALNEASRGSSAGARTNRTGALIVIAEMGLSVVLLAGAGLLLQSFFRLMHVSLGFDPHNVLTFQIALPSSKYPQPFQKSEFHSQLRDRIAALPGVRSVSTAELLPPNGGLMAPYLPEGMPNDLPRGQRPLAQWNSISPRYFETLGIPLLKGRIFTDADRETSQEVVIVSQNLAAHYWPHEDPIGKHIQVARQRTPSEIVGIVGDVRNSGLGANPFDELYTPLPQRPWTSMLVVVKTVGDPMQIVPAVRSAITTVDRDQPMTQVSVLEENLSASVSQERLTAVLLGAFAAIALTLAAVGIYGVTSYSVVQRRKEIGIRIAMGAQPRDILYLVLRFGAMLALIGVAIGLVAALVLTQLVKSLLYGVSASDPITLVGVSGVLIAVTLLACYISARRAMAVDPVIALRAE